MNEHEYIHVRNLCIPTIAKMKWLHRWINMESLIGLKKKNKTKNVKKDSLKQNNNEPLHNDCVCHTKSLKDVVVTPIEI